MGEEKTPHTVKVVDRRRFTTDGVLRDDDLCAESPVPEMDSNQSVEAPTDVPDSEASPHPTQPPAGSHSERVDPMDGEHSATTSPEFVDLVVMLARQAELLLVGTEESPAQPDEARRLIDCLGALQTKTDGNLSSDEQQVLSDILFQLRTVFVQSPR